MSLEHRNETHDATKCAAEHAAEHADYATLEDGPAQKTSCYGARARHTELMQTAKALEAARHGGRTEATGSRLKAASMGTRTLRTS